jgi:MoxR-like ATPase
VRELVDWGAGPRAGSSSSTAAKALAAMDGRFSVAIEDIQKIAIPVLRHRISTNFQAQAHCRGLGRPEVRDRALAAFDTASVSSVLWRDEPRGLEQSAPAAL